MKIAVVYFNADKLPKDRQHHGVTDVMMDVWLHWYRRSGTTLQPVLLVDKDTTVPDQWSYDVLCISQVEPPTRKDVLNKVGWMKAQAYELLGRCVVMDLDAIPVRSLDPLAKFDCQLAMSPDFGLRTTWRQDFPEVGTKNNAGVMVFNSAQIWPEFQKLWTKHWDKWNHITYFDELLFTILNHRMGIELPIIYNMPPDEGVAESLASGARVVHFSGDRKKLASSLLPEVWL